MIRKILIYNSGGGLGDSILLIPLILSLQNKFDNSEIYYLGAHENHFSNKLKEYNIKIKNLEMNLKYFGFRWWHLLKVKENFRNLKISKFDLIIDCQSKLRNTLILKQIPSSLFYSSTFNYLFCSKIKKGRQKLDVNSYIPDKLISDLEEFLNLNLKKISYDIDKIPKLYLDEAKHLLPDKNYIGISFTQGNEYRKKMWSLNNFINLAKELELKGKKIIFFVERSHKDAIDKIRRSLPNASFPELDSSLSCPLLVTALSTRLEKAVTIDNGIMHMIGLANIPMVVLFGPTNASKFVPKNDNIKVLDSKKIYNSEDVSKIKIEDVIKQI